MPTLDLPPRRTRSVPRTLDDPAKRTRSVSQDGRGWAAGATATIVVGASFPISAALEDFPPAFAQGSRYTLGALILFALLKGRPTRPSARELLGLAAVAAVGMAGFNLFLLAAVERIGGANTGVVVGLSPLLLALTRPTRRLVTSALVVVAGAAVVTGTDGAVTTIGLLLAFGVLFCEVGFTLLAAPLLPRLGPLNVAAWASAAAAVELLLVAALIEHPRMPTTEEAGAILYLAVITTALAFTCYFSAVQRLGAHRAGLLAGLMPVAAVAVDAVLTHNPPSIAAIVGTLLVAGGVALGSRRRSGDFSARAMEPAAHVG
jgi:drug/metabolite transporter (DMT)-like permease